jgi:predicted ATP-dependent protease
MLSEEVVDAVRRGEFHVWAVDNVDEGMALLTGRDAPEVHRLVAERLSAFAESVRAVGGEAPNGSPALGLPPR